MGLNRGLQGLIERAWTLHHGISAEIENSTSFCRFCSQNGRYCAIVEAPSPEKEILIAIRNSLQEVRDLLMFLQKLQYWQPIEMQETLARLEKSRISLVEEVKRYEGRPLSVLEELNSSFDSGENAFDWNLKDGKMNNLKPQCSAEKKKRRLIGFAICCIRRLFRPWKWQQPVVFAAKLLIVYATITSTVNLCQARQQHNCSTSQKKALSFVKSNGANTIPSVSKTPVHVFLGRG